MDDVAEQVQQLIAVVTNTRSLYFALAVALAKGTASEVIYAARACHEIRGVLAKLEFDLAAFEAARRLGLRHKVMSDLRRAWDGGYAAGIAEGTRRAHFRAIDQAEDEKYPPLRLVRALPG